MNCEELWTSWAAGHLYTSWAPQTKAPSLGAIEFDLNRPQVGIGHSLALSTRPSPFAPLHPPSPAYPLPLKTTMAPTPALTPVPYIYPYTFTSGGTTYTTFFSDYIDHTNSYPDSTYTYRSKDYPSDLNVGGPVVTAWAIAVGWLTSASAPNHAEPYLCLAL